MSEVRTYVCTYLCCCSLFQAISEQLSELDVKVFKEYIERKRQPLLATLEEGMYTGSFDWEECAPVEGREVWWGGEGKRRWWWIEEGR